MRLKKLKVYILAKPSLEQTSIELFLSENKRNWAQDPDSTQMERIVEIAGRVCYMSFSDNTDKIRYPNAKYIRNIIDKEHESVLEHVSWTFILDGVSRAFTHQLVRHRVGFSFSQLSQQYRDESEAEFVAPYGLTKDSPEYNNWVNSIYVAMDAYKDILRDITEEQQSTLSKKERLRFNRSLARSLLPNATSTTIVVTANARSLRHFFKVRGTIEGDYEMRFVCAKLLNLVKLDAPSLFQDFNITKHQDNEPIITID